MKVVEFGKKTLKRPTEKTEADIKKLKKEMERPVKGKFEFVDAQGGWIDFNWRFFKDDPLMKFTLTHGEICELPLGIVKHLNNTVKKVRKLGALDENGKAITSIEINSRVRFTPLEVL